MTALSTFRVCNACLKDKLKLFLYFQCRLCNPLSDNDDDISNFVESLAGNFMVVVQYNKDNTAVWATNMNVEWQLAEACVTIRIRSSEFDRKW